MRECRRRGGVDERVVGGDGNTGRSGEGEGRARPSTQGRRVHGRLVQQNTDLTETRGGPLVIEHLAISWGTHILIPESM